MTLSCHTIRYQCHCFPVTLSWYCGKWDIYSNVKVDCTGSEATAHQPTDGAITIQLSGSGEYNCSIRVQFPDGGYGHEALFRIPEFIGGDPIPSNSIDYRGLSVSASILINEQYLKDYAPLLVFGSTSCRSYLVWCVLGFHCSQTDFSWHLRCS